MWQKIKDYFPLILCILSGIFTLYIFNQRVDLLIDADTSNEMILGKLLAEEGGILSKDWFYSTELRVINIQIVYKLGFLLFDNWHYVRIFSIACFMVTIFASYYFLAYSANLRKYALITGLPLLLPFSSQYCTFILLGGYYLTHLLFIFLTLALLLFASKSKKFNLIFIFINCLIALAGGLNGFRYLVILYFPLFMISFLFYVSNNANKVLSFFRCSIILLFFNLIGIFVNLKIFSNIYKFSHMENGAKIADNFDLIGIINFSVNSLLYIFGKTNSTVDLISISGLANISAFIASGLLLWFLIFLISKNSYLSFEKKYLISFGIASYTVTAVATFVCQMGVSTRYLLPSGIFLFLVYALYLQYLDDNNLHKQSKITILCMIVPLFITGICEYSLPSLRYNEIKLSTLKEATYWLLSNGYTQGLATYWNAAPLTELSNGKIDMYSLKNVESEREWMNMEFDQHLQRISKTLSRPSGKIFLLLSDEERNNDKTKMYASDDHLVYSHQGINIYSYDDMDVMLANILHKNISPCAKIVVGGEAQVPRLMLLNGHYVLNIVCRNLNKDVELRLFNKKFSLKNGKNQIPVDIGGYFERIDFSIKNTTDRDIFIDSVSFD